MSALNSPRLDVDAAVMRGTSHASHRSASAYSSAVSRRRGSTMSAVDGGPLIPNMSPKSPKPVRPWASLDVPGPSRLSAFPRASELSVVKEKSRKSFLVRRMLEKSQSKDIEKVNVRFQSLPRALRDSRSSTVDYVHTVLDDPTSGRVAWWTAKCLEAVVLISVLATFLQTVEDPPLHGWSAAIVETIFDIVFLVEVVTRWVCAPNWVNFFFIPNSWIDLLAASAIVVRAAVGFVLPESQDDAISVMLLCFVPIIRLLKILRNFETFNVLIQALKITMEALPMLLYSVALITMTFATLIYLVEPEIFESPFRAVWFCLVTVTTVGYGDYSPVTTAGTTIVMVLIVMGVIMMAVPIGIIGSTFNQVWNARDYSLLLSKTRKKVHQWGYTADDIHALFKAAGHSDDTGVLELDDFCELVKEMKIGLSEDRVIALFHHMDKEGSGALDAAEFARAIFPGARFDYMCEEERPRPFFQRQNSPKIMQRQSSSNKSLQRQSSGRSIRRQSSGKSLLRLNGGPFSRSNTSGISGNTFLG
ncbi:unnamed protein product [Prorocentrum cordatum]|uniref:EF-hand domain-containing protein n=1 Tax=Prorocentrum cordatum TaxID=2364126 RepID=A0ABN9VTZ9_9DINO|nr:unnamed protein product [Polarella glacialis]